MPQRRCPHRFPLCYQSP
ncbi:hypothetical protein Taro_019145 [Colocasia esculenta]|uniref:Uncharacterized protein n=1 Tax=Colocasia esculenta TaxID=4460 RepID=A0A843UYE8_COLES|nr:hypothetical protein [Colocasia esculenta]